MGNYKGRMIVTNFGDVLWELELLEWQNIHNLYDITNLILYGEKMNS